ncbi:MFS transporter [Agrobacterium vitis]
MAFTTLRLMLANRFPALQIRNFRIFYLGLLLSLAGPWMQTTAQAWLVLKLSDSSLALATVTSLQFLPIMLLALVGGVVADRFPRRRLMAITQSLAAVQALVLGVLVMTDTIALWHIYLLALSLGVINALDNPLRQAFVSELVDVPRLGNAIALVSMMQNLGRIIGPAIGGVVIAAFGVGPAFLINAVTCSTILFALASIRAADLQPIRFSGRYTMISQIAEGLRYARKTPSILFLLIATAFIGMFGQNFTTIVPLAANYLVHAGAAEFGLLNSSLGMGSFFSAFMLTGRRKPTVGLILVAGLSFGLVLIAIAFCGSLIVSCLLFLLVGAAAVTFSTSVAGSLQIQSPPEMRGRFASMIHLLITGSSPIGAMMTGVLAEHFGVPAAISTNGVLCCIGTAFAFFYFHRMRRNFPFDLTRPAPDSPAQPIATAQPAE